MTLQLLPEHLLAAAADFLLFFAGYRQNSPHTGGRRIVVYSRNWKGIVSICQTQDRLIEDDGFFRGEIWSEVVGVNSGIFLPATPISLGVTSVRHSHGHELRLESHEVKYRSIGEKPLQNDSYWKTPPAAQWPA